MRWGVCAGRGEAPRVGGGKRSTGRRLGTPAGLLVARWRCATPSRIARGRGQVAATIRCNGCGCSEEQTMARRRLGPFSLRLVASCVWTVGEDSDDSDVLALALPLAPVHDVVLGCRAGGGWRRLPTAAFRALRRARAAWRSTGSRLPPAYASHPCRTAVYGH